jgi:hypothetical protein
MSISETSSSPGPGWGMLTGDEVFAARPWLVYLDLFQLDGREAQRVQEWFEKTATLPLLGMGMYLLGDPWLPNQWAPTRVEVVSTIRNVVKIAQEEPCPVQVLVATPKDWVLTDQHLTRSLSVAELAIRGTYRYSVSNYSNWVWARTFSLDEVPLSAASEESVGAFLEQISGRCDQVPDSVRHMLLLLGQVKNMDEAFTSIVELIRRSREKREAPTNLCDLVHFSSTLQNSGTLSYGPTVMRPMPREFEKMIKDRIFGLTQEWLNTKECEVLWLAFMHGDWQRRFG